MMASYMKLKSWSEEWRTLVMTLSSKDWTDNLHNLLQTPKSVSEVKFTYRMKCCGQG